MKLYTEQGHNLKLNKEPRDRKLGTYANDPEIANEMAKLYDEYLNTDQVIWCSRDHPTDCSSRKPNFIHEIDVDESDVFAILDGMVWENIIGNKTIPEEESLNIRIETMYLESSKMNRIRDEKKQEYLRKNLPNDLWWDLIKNDINCRMAQILLKWPLEKSIITSVKDSSKANP